MAKNETLRGAVSNLQFIEKTGRAMRYTDNPEVASVVTFEVDGRVVSAVHSGFPAIREGDDVEVTGTTARAGLEVVKMHNHTTGTDWQFSPWGTARRGFFKDR